MDFSIQSPDYSSVVEYDMFSGQQVLIRIVVEYISYVSSSHGFLTDMLESLEALPKIRNNEEDTDKIRNFFQESVSLGQELKVFFTVPNQQILSNISPTPNPNEVVAAFINFLLLMVEVILCFQPDLVACVKGLIQNLRTELGFLIAFLGDTAMHLQPTKNIVIDIEAVVNEVGSFLYSFFFIIIIVFNLTTEKKETIKAMKDIEDVVSEVQNFLHSLEDMPLLNKNAMTDIKALVHEVGSFLDFVIFTGNDQIPKSKILDLALSHLLRKFEFLKTKIKEHCITVSKMPSDMAPKTAVVSLFIIDSVLDDLMHLINNKSDRIVGVDDQIVKLHEELNWDLPSPI
ncbi:putative late blight resistance protein-like protein R1A-10 [Forsythia ovata]|uniref:Late blight resistance protein-like protein R1A-10 n=1 Tax=Forsythia ovata TaxID=205694 RepID=A0ABD1WPW6_9LAMI